MRAGEFEEGARTLRAKIDVTSPVLVLRDPLLYRIVKASHHSAPAIAGASTRCTTSRTRCRTRSRASRTRSARSEFVDHRPLYDWAVEHCSTPSRPRQTEFGRLNLTYTMMSKRC